MEDLNNYLYVIQDARDAFLSKVGDQNSKYGTGNE